MLYALGGRGFGALAELEDKWWQCTTVETGVRLFAFPTAYRAPSSQLQPAVLLALL